MKKIKILNKRPVYPFEGEKEVCGAQCDTGDKYYYDFVVEVSDQYTTTTTTTTTTAGAQIMWPNVTTATSEPNGWRTYDNVGSSTESIFEVATDTNT